jgi:hypothetical protein
MVECLHRVGEGRALGPVSWKVDPVVQAMVSSWPPDVDAGRAIAAGIPPTDELDRIVREAVDTLGDPG